MADHVCYVYGVVPSTLAVEGAPPGVDDAPVRLERAGDLAALYSSLDGALFAPEVLESRTADLGWLGPRAEAHDRVVTWAGDGGAVIPLPMFSLFRDASGVRAMLAERAEFLRRTLARVAPGREFGLRVFRLDEVLRDRIGTLSAPIAELERAVAGASPGQRYLLERKLDKERKSEAKRVGREAARDVFDTLASRSLEAVRDPLPAADRESGAGAAVLNAAFLVGRDATEPFREALTVLVGRLEPAGFRFEFTGPWPPYHFVRESAAPGADE